MYITYTLTQQPKKSQQTADCVGDAVVLDLLSVNSHRHTLEEAATRATRHSCVRWKSCC